MSSDPDSHSTELTVFIGGESIALRSSQLVTRGLNELMSAASNPEEQALLSDALRGDAAAQWKLGGQCRTRCDYVEALKWYRMVAEQVPVDPRFAQSLGWRHERGLGVPQNLAEAAWWYRLAADTGDLLSAVWLGSMYSQGKGVPQDSDEAQHWFRLAGEKAIQENDILIMGALGNAYSYSGALCDATESIKWYCMAAERGATQSMLSLAEFYRKGWGVEQSFATMAEWLRLAAENGDSTGAVLLGVCYELGRGVPMDYVQAYAWTRRSIFSQDLYRDPGLLDPEVEQLMSQDPAIGRLKVLAEKMVPQELAEAERLASEWNPRQA